MQSRRYFRRIIGVAICSIPIILAILCIIWKKEVYDVRVSAALIIVGLSFLIGCLNLYLTFLRPFLYKQKHKSMDGYRFISGIPLVGNLLLIGGCVIAFGNNLVGFAGVLSALIDSGGLLWVPFITWKDSSLWDI